MSLNIKGKEQKGNSGCHIPNEKFRDSYDNIRKMCGCKMGTKCMCGDVSLERQKSWDNDQQNCLTGGGTNVRPGRS